MRQDKFSDIITVKQEPSELQELNLRSREIFRQIVDAYLTTGEPVGSRNISQQLPISLSPASVRNVMSDLEALGLICAPHTSAGRLPTEMGLRLFVDGLLEIGDLSAEERHHIERQLCSGKADEQHEKNVGEALSDVGELLSGLSQCAGVVLTEKKTARLKHIEFIKLEPRKALVILVGEDGSVENRILSLPAGLPPSSLVEASNYLNARIGGMTITEAEAHIRMEISSRKAELDGLTAKIIEDGLAVWSGEDEDTKSLIIRGRSHLLDNLEVVEDLERIRHLFDDLEAKKDLIKLLDFAEHAEGVRIFIGSENQLFSLSGSSLIVSPFNDSEHNIVGVLGIIGPTRLNYAKIIPMVDYTAKLISRIIP